MRTTERAHHGGTRARRPLALLTVLLLALTIAPAGAIAGSGISIDPEVNDFDLPEGDTWVETISVTVPEDAVVPAADVYLLMDTTGSMGSSINAMADNAEAVVDGLTTDLTGVDLRFGVGDFKDFQSPTQADPYAFNHAQDITGDTDAVRAAIADWSASGGGDAPEGHFYAYDQIAANRAPSHDGSDAGTIGWRGDAKRILVVFADVAGHDLVCQEITHQVPGHGLDYDITEGSATAKLVDAGITFIGISAPTGAGMDAARSGSNYNSACGQSGASAGQATRLAEATGGVFLDSVGSGAIVDAVRDQITAAVSTINSLQLSATGDTAQFVSSITPVDGYGPLAVGEEHVLTFEVAWEGTVAAEDDDQVFTGSLDVRADGSVATNKPVTIRVPGTAARVDALSLAPVEASGSVGDEHTVTARLTDDEGDALAGATIEFTVVDGPNEGLTGSADTDTDGEATFAYLGEEVGTDVIVATHTPDEGDPVTSNHATMDWVQVLAEGEGAGEATDEDDVEEIGEAAAADAVEAEPDYTG